MSFRNSRSPATRLVSASAKTVEIDSFGVAAGHPTPTIPPWTASTIANSPRDRLRPCPAWKCPVASSDLASLRELTAAVYSG